MSLRFSFLIILASTDFEKMSEKMINMFKGKRLFWGGGGSRTWSEKEVWTGGARTFFLLVAELEIRNSHGHLVRMFCVFVYFSLYWMEWSINTPLFFLRWHGGFPRVRRFATLSRWQQHSHSWCSVCNETGFPSNTYVIDITHWCKKVLVYVPVDNTHPLLDIGAAVYKSACCMRGNTVCGHLDDKSRYFD